MAPFKHPPGGSLTAVKSIATLPTAPYGVKGVFAAARLLDVTTVNGREVRDERMVAL